MGNHASAYLRGYQPEPDKGQPGGSCNRTNCQRPRAIWLHGNGKYYCGSCAADLNFIHRGNPHWVRMQTTSVALCAVDTVKQAVAAVE